LKRPLDLDEVVREIAERHGCGVVLDLLAEGIRQSRVRCTPAMAAGAADRLWEASDLVALLEASERGLERAA
jgi:hypothetical protein